MFNLNKYLVESPILNQRSGSENRLIWDDCTPTMDRRPTTYRDIDEDIHVRDYDSPEELYDELLHLSRFTEEDFEEHDTFMDRINDMLNCLDDPGDGSPNILYIKVDGEPLQDGAYGDLRDLDPDTCTEADVKRVSKESLKNQIEDMRQTFADLGIDDDELDSFFDDRLDDEEDDDDFVDDQDDDDLDESLLHRNNYDPEEEFLGSDKRYEELNNLIFEQLQGQGSIELYLQDVEVEGDDIYLTVSEYVYKYDGDEFGHSLLEDLAEFLDVSINDVDESDINNLTDEKFYVFLENKYRDNLIEKMLDDTDFMRSEYSDYVEQCKYESRDGDY